MKKLAWLLLLLLLAGCSSGGERAQINSYLKSLDPFQKDLQRFQGELQQRLAVPMEKRKDAVVGLADEVKARGEQLKQLHPPPRALPLHQKTQDLYQTLEAYLRKAAVSADGQDPELKKLTEQWKKQLGEADAELTRLGASK